MPESIDIFNIHQRIMDDYKHFVSSFINIKDEKIKEIVETEINQGKFWPEPLIQFNPSFEQGESAQSLCDKGIMHPDLSKIFKNYDLFKHQVEAIKKGCNGLDFVVTSGTGSGKSLTFLGTIFDYLLKNKTGSGIKAVIVYPINALINSQFKGIDEMETELEHLGEEYHDFRRKLMLKMKLGLTKTYNQIHNPDLRGFSNDDIAIISTMKDKEFQKQYGKETVNLWKHLNKTEGVCTFNEAVQNILHLRELHKQMDAVLKAYGWEDINLVHDFYEVDYLPENDRVRYTISPDARKEVLKHLLKLNHEIHEQEVKAGLHVKGKTKKKQKADASEQMKLF